MCRSLSVLLITSFLAGPALASDQTKEEDPRVALAAELLELMNVDQTLSQIHEQIDAMMMAQVGDMPSSCPAVQPVVEEFAKAQSELFSEMFNSDRYLSGVGAVYVEVFSEEELRELLEFYHSSLGKKLIDRQPLLLQRSMAVGQEMAQAAMPEVRRLSERFTEQLALASAECDTAASD